MKKSEMKKNAKLFLLSEFKQVILFTNSTTLKNKHDVVWNKCENIFGSLWAYYFIGILSDSEYELFYNITSNISVYHNVFGKVGKYGSEI